MKKKCALLGLFACLVCIIMACAYEIQTKNYKEVDALIIGATTTMHRSTSDNSYSYADYDTYQYTVNGKTYETEMQVLKKGKQGDHVKVKYDPSDPGRLYNRFRQTVLVGLIIFMCIFTVGVTLCDDTPKERRY